MDQNGYYQTGASSNASYAAEGGGAAGGARMNGEIPSVPITTLAGIASLTDLLPELPVPGPAPHANPNPGSTLLYHRTLVAEASQLLTSPGEALVNQVTGLLSSTSVDYVQLSGKNAANPPQSVPQNSLANVIYRNNPAALGGQPHQSQQWSGHNSYHQPLSSREDFASGSEYAGQQQQQSNFVQQQHQYSQEQSYNSNSSGYGNSNRVQENSYAEQGSQSAHQSQQAAQEQQPAAQAHDQRQSGTAVSNHEGMNNNAHQNNGEVIANEVKAEQKVTPKAGGVQLKLNINKLSKEAEELMLKSGVKAGFKELRNDQVKAEEMGVYNNFTPRSLRARNNVDDGSVSEDSEGDESKKGGRNKFFKASEKERDEERKKMKEFRRKRMLEDGDEPEYFGKRRKEEAPKPPSPKPFQPKKVTRTVARDLVPRLPKMSVEDLMEQQNTFKKFNGILELIFENMEEINLQDFEQMDEGTEIPQEILIPKYQLADLASETAKLKSRGAMESISSDKLVKLLNILELNIRDGSKVVPLANDDDDDRDDELYLETARERVSRAADASLTVLNILTSKKMSKRVYIDDVIDRVALFLRFQLSNTIYPCYDPVYKEISKSKTGYVEKMKKKRSFAANVRDRYILGMYNKMRELTSMTADLVRMQLLTDTTILHISGLGVTPFFVENIPELQLAALKLVTNLFSKYEKHRKLLLDDILASIARLPSSKRSLRSFQLNPTTHIQMLTALVLQLIQCVVFLPKRLADPEAAKAKKPKDEEEDVVELDSDSSVDRDVLVNEKYKMAMATAHQFLIVFLKKCGSQKNNDDVDYRPLFENFVQDLLTTVNTPEWPAAELLLSLLGRVLKEKFSNKGTEMALRISSLEYLGVVAARLRRDAVQSKLKLDYIDSIVRLIKEAECEDKGDQDVSDEKGKGKKNKKKDKNSFENDPDEERNVFLQRVLLDFLAVSGGEDDQSSNIMNARHFYISQWYRDVNALGKKPKKRKRPKLPNSHRKKGGRKDETSSEEESSEEEDEEEDMPDSQKSELYRAKEKRKDLLLSKIPPFGLSKGHKAQVLSTHIDHDCAHLIVKYLSSKRPFFNSFNYYLQDILNVLTEQSTHIRTKALKCMTMVVTEDPEVLLRENMRQGVNYSFTDSSTMVREAAVDLIGKFILHKQELITQYYKVITDRILDTGVSVRKRVIKILRDICLEYPGYAKIPEMCVKMIRRVKDEEGIRKLVMEVFQNMWFQPVRENRRTQEEEELLVTKCRNITDVIVACTSDGSGASGLGWFEDLLATLFRPREDKEDATKKNTEPPPQLVLACQQIVDCLVESVLSIEESSIRGASSEGKTLGSSNRIVACLTTLYLFAKIRPQLLVEHVQTIQPYLQVQCKTAGDFQIISNVARTLELAVPLIKHPSEIFLSQLEEDSVKLILKHDKKVISSCVSCLGSIVNNVTKNFKLIRDCFVKYYDIMMKFRRFYEDNPTDPRLTAAAPTFRRALFTVSLLLRHFNFSAKDVYEGLASGADTVEEVFETTFFFMLHEKEEIQLDTLHALGSICIRHYNFMLESKLKELYLEILQNDIYSVGHKIKVLQNLELYLVEEEERMRRQDEHWQEYSQKENLKEMGDVTSGMASSVIQKYLKNALEAFLNSDVRVRHASMKVVNQILAQGLVNPVQICSYLICMSTDSESKIAHTADVLLQDIEKKYPGFIHMKLLKGILLSHRLQEIMAAAAGNSSAGSVIVRGCRVKKDDEMPTALHGFLYSIMKTTKATRRAIMTKLLQRFDDSQKSPLTLMLYLADNLAYIPFTVVDEPLFVIHQIDIMISVSGSNLLQTFKENLRPPPSAEAKHNLETGKTDYIYDEDLDDEFDSVISRLPDDCRGLQDAITASQGCMLLLVLKEHLKDLYGLTASKVQQYSPTDTSKAFDRQVNRRTNVRFNPKATIEILQKGPPPEMLTEEEKTELVQKYLQFKELMNKIDPDDEEEEDEDGTTTPKKGNNANMPGVTPGTPGQRKSLVEGSGGAAVSYHQPHQQAYLRQQLNQQQQQLQKQFGSSRPQRNSSATASPFKRPSRGGGGDYGNSVDESGMVLDPSTGMMVAAGGDGDDDDIIFEGQSSSSAGRVSRQGGRDESNCTTKDAINRLPKLKINLGSKIRSSEEKQHRHHRHHHKKKKKKRRRHSNDDDEGDAGDGGESSDEAGDDDDDPDFAA